MTAIAYQAMESKVQAPTGERQSPQFIQPEKNWGEEKAENIFYLTAKTITRTVAEDTIKLLKTGIICISSNDYSQRKNLYSKKCSVTESCERAKGHFDRINEDLYLLILLVTSAEKIFFICGKACNVCPYELSFVSSSMVGPYHL